jgi:two-component system sensor histidine kinase/response regulator
MPNPKILVIDDQLLSTRLLERRLVRSDMQVFSAVNGTEGLQLAREIRPDVILLDIVMPGMDGLTVCRELKKDDDLKDIPVIFITARTGTQDKVEGFDVGGTDFLVKPLNLDEAHARVKTQLRIIEEHRANLRLTRELEQSRRQSSIMHLTEGIAHNLNNLLGVMVGHLSLLKRNVDNPEKILGNLDRMDSAIRRMTRIVQQLTVIGQFKSLKKEKVTLQRILTGAVARFHRAAATDCPVQQDIQLPDDYQFHTNRELLEVCLERLLHNAFESYKSSEGKPAENPDVRLEIRPQGDNKLIIAIMDRGKGIDPDIRDSIFEPFVTSSSVIGRGMGLTIARHSVECLEGTIEVGDREDRGTMVTILLPLTPDEEL